LVEDVILRDDEYEYDDHFFPLLGIIYSIRKDRVHIMYRIKRYGFNNADQMIDADINCESEARADELAKEVGEVLDKMHLHQRLEVDQENMLKELTKRGEAGFPPGE